MATSPQALAALPGVLPPVQEEAVMPAGFRAGTATSGIKPSGRPDLCIVAATGPPAAAAAVFTRNQVVAAPITVSRAHLAETGVGSRGRFGWADAVVCTSGCANAATGAPGVADQEQVCAAVAAALSSRPERVLALSTGLIGTRLPVELVRAGIAGLAARLSAADDALAEVTAAMMTTDTRPKSAAVSIELAGAGGPGKAPVRVTVTGLAKGVGMIHPRMATMLALVLTDATVEPGLLYEMLAPIAQRTWNQLSVDGDTSTNDTVFLLASGGAGAAPVAAGSDGAAALSAAIEAVARSLARQQAADGEGATTLVTCQVSGAADDHDARAVARAVVSSSLLKTAVHGRDPNWGRVAGAAGNARLPDEELLEAAGLHHTEAMPRAGRRPELDVERLRIAIAGTLVFAGAPMDFDRDAVARAMDAPEVLIRLDLGLGDGRGEAFGCDLTEEYVIENAEYTT
jgi:glutamate N-acetyltransferase/amino-acid N-acetyltransferase